jgi:WD40 repeat protein
MQETRGIKPCQTFTGHTKRVMGVSHLPDGQRIVTSSSDDSLRVWNLQSGKQISNGWQNEELYIGHVNVMALSPDGQKIVSENGFWDIDGHGDFVMLLGEKAPILLQHFTNTRDTRQ